MSEFFSPETFETPKPRLIQNIESLYSAAYELQMGGGSPVGVAYGKLGYFEAIGLNPTPEGNQEDNVRYIIFGGSLDFCKIEAEIEGDKLTIAYAMVRFTLPPESTTPVEELLLDDVVLGSVIFIGPDGRVTYGEEAWFTDDEVVRLTDSIQACTVAPKMPVRFMP